MSTKDLQDESFIRDEQLQDDPISESDESLDPRQAEFLKQYRVVSRIALCALASSIVAVCFPRWNRRPREHFPRPWLSRLSN